VAVAVIDEDGYEVWGYGETKLNSSDVPDENTVFGIGSVTKPFNGVLLADSYLRGKISLTAPVSTYLTPGQIVPSYDLRNITLIDLATHTSGLPAVPDAFFEGYSEGIPAGKNTGDVYEEIMGHYGTYPSDEVYAWLGGVNLTRSIGSTWEYSNVGAAILGDALSRANNQGYPDLLRERITGPLGMNSTAGIMTPDMAARAVTGYRNYGGPLAQARNLQFNAFWLPGGGLYSTPRDMVRFTTTAMGLTPSALYEAFTISMLPFAMREVSPQTMYQGLQWDIVPLPDGTEVVMKSGETPAFQTQIAFSPQHRKGVIIFTNTATITGPHVSSEASDILLEMIMRP
jgi:CubicO group peptidase (beta-lactamase class C family)